MRPFATAIGQQGATKKTSSNSIPLIERPVGESRAGHLQIAGARNDGRTALEAMISQHPMPIGIQGDRVNDLIRRFDEATPEQRVRNRRACRHPDLAPRPPIDGEDILFAPAECVSVEERVGRRVIDLPGGGFDRADRRRTKR